MGYRNKTFNKGRHTTSGKFHAFYASQQKGAPFTSGLCFRRYMNMRNLLIAIYLITFQLSAIACTYIKEIDDGSVTIKIDDDPSSGIYHVRVPPTHKGKPIEYLVLSANDEKNEIAVPLAIKNKNGETGSYFYLPSKWVNVTVSANYEGSRCYSLVAKLNM